MIMKSLIPIVMAGILGIYGMIVGVILLKDGKNIALTQSATKPKETTSTGSRHTGNLALESVVASAPLLLGMQSDLLVM